MKGNILVVDDEEKIRHLLSLMLEGNGFTVEQAEDGHVALEILRGRSLSFDMVITDIKMPRMDGLSLLEKINEHNIPCPVIFITAFATVDSAVDAMQRGAVDYITKPFEESRILLTVERAMKLSRILTENRDLKQRLQKAESAEKIVYTSEKMVKIMELASRVAQSDSAVMISGESGTGKELLARYIHRTSPRCDNRFVPVNCAAISSNLVESELFGHERGAFTGAERKTQGKFEYASGGTLFLDEIGDLPIEAQAKLLRALQEKKIQRVGGNEEIPVDVRVVCATNQNLAQKVKEGEFRQDLFFRINVFPIHPPPLRERPEDIIPLSRYFLSKFQGSRVQLRDDAIQSLSAYSWPGNVRELANAVERALILAGEDSEITEDILSFLSGSQMCFAEGKTFVLPPEGIELEEIEKNFVSQALDMSQQNQTAAAKLLGISRAKFRVLLKQYKKNA